MSVYCNFRKVWMERFPDSELPAAWEEDVRSNLMKHRQVNYYSIDEIFYR